MPALPIASAVNQSYVLPLAVLMASIKRHLSAEFHPVLYLIHAGLPQTSLDILSSLMEIHSIIPSAELVSSMPQDSHYPREATFPLLLAEVLPPSLDRVLFLDADMLALDDLAKLWETPLDQHVLGACRDVALPFCSSPRAIGGWQALGIPDDAPHFNGGVLLVHLQRWRERQITSRVLDYLASTSEPLDFLHQEAMNAVLWNDWQMLGPRWNLLGSRSGRSFERPASDAWRHPGIVHFSGAMKPWRIHIGGPFYEPYRDVLEEILPLFPARPSTVRDKLHGFYDRNLRGVLFPLEQYLWNRRLL